jgi:hypothetical protein
MRQRSITISVTKSVIQILVLHQLLAQNRKVQACVRPVLDVLAHPLTSNAISGNLLDLIQGADFEAFLHRKRKDPNSLLLKYSIFKGTAALRDIRVQSPESAAVASLLEKTCLSSTGVALASALGSVGLRSRRDFGCYAGQCSRRRVRRCAPWPDVVDEGPSSHRHG